MGISTQREELADEASAAAQWAVTDAGDYKRFEFVVTTTGSWSVTVEGKHRDGSDWAPLTAATVVNATTEYFSVVTGLDNVRLNGVRTGGNLSADVVKSDSHPLRW